LGREKLIGDLGQVEVIVQGGPHIAQLLEIHAAPLMFASICLSH
jgi:hypothetical protein